MKNSFHEQAKGRIYANSKVCAVISLQSGMHMHPILTKSKIKLLPQKLNFFKVPKIKLFQP
jgi:hypothetical protein